MRRRCIELEVLNHGVEHEQDFQGHGVSFTRFTECVTGIGHTAGEALEDAIEALDFKISLSSAQIDLLNEHLGEWRIQEGEEKAMGMDRELGEGEWWYVSIDLVTEAIENDEESETES